MQGLKPGLDSHTVRLIFFIQNKDRRLVTKGFLGSEFGEAHDGEQISRLSKMGGGAIQFDRSGSHGPVNDVSLKSLAIGQVGDEDALVTEEADFFGQILGNRQASLVVQTGGGHRGAMNF